MDYRLSFRKQTLKEYIERTVNLHPAIKWSYAVPITNNPINYLEIGVFHGKHAIDVADTYCKHPDSKVYCVDPWKDYDEYPEYKGEQDTIYDTFTQNINKYGNLSKFVINRGLSEDIVPTFDNNFFDIIFVDGNHETEYVYADGKMSFDKVKPGGYIIFDDYDWIQTKKGINMFLYEYLSKIKIIENKWTNNLQVIIQKL